MKKYGLIGKKLDYSYSKIIHDELIKSYDFQANYQLIETNSINRELLEKYDGLNITIPYKEEVLNYIDKNVDKLPCNTIVNRDNQLFAYNTDIYGFDFLVKKLGVLNIEKVVILGSGASSKLIQHYFKDKEVIVISRSSETNNYSNLKKINADLLVNATPVGMNEYISPINEEYLSNFKAVIDLNYNPINSKLALDCAKHNITFVGGIDMLLVQAIKSFELWHNVIVNRFDAKKIKLKLLAKINQKIAFVGLSLSGKTTLVKKYNGIDLDEAIEKKYNEDIDKMIDNGNFRKRETSVLKELVNENYQLIACGGGIVLNHENMELLKDYLIVHLQVDIDVLIERFISNPRPLIKSQKQLLMMNEKRKELYQKYADIELNKKEAEEFLDEISNH
ncbi:shikimate dehydrogenase [Bacilli bacterium PM5-3]|nr:shikimate dehydrogenase [Bacilli bacterium PM5-3]